MKKLLCYSLMLFALIACNEQATKKSEPQKIETMTQQTIDKTIADLKAKYPDTNQQLMQKGVELTAKFWQSADGTSEEFTNFCTTYYQPEGEAKKLLLDRFRNSLEAVYGRFGQVATQLQYPMHVDKGDLLVVDELFAAWSPYAHINDDWFGNKLAHILHLNFPFYTIEECYQNGVNWTDEQWAQASLGGMFSSRVPAKLQQEASDISTKSEMYISDYNIYMNNIVDENGNKYFAEGIKLISHWGLRDQLKGEYGNKTAEGLLKQNLIYDLMVRIINQEVPKILINNPKGGEYCPTNNKLTEGGKEATVESENDMRYAMLLDNFKAEKAFDPYSPLYPDAIKRGFDQNLRMTPDEVEQMFISLLSAPVNKELGALISERLGRPLQPYDIWYDGFKSRSTVDKDMLNDKVRKMYPTAQHFENDLANILQKLGYAAARAKEIASKVAVDPARGSGHAMGATIKGDVSRLRARFPKEGLDYLGYNISMHEFGHNVEQTISLYDIPDYLNSGIPNTAFTEALAFVFQKRDLAVLGIKNNDPKADAGTTLDIYWGCYEIMGVALVDLYTWRYMYANPDITPAQLKEAVINISKEVWNKYYASVFGVNDSPILGIYSHMISYPLYLAAYPIGHLIEFQLEQHLKGKNFATEIDRIYSIGNRPPQIWMNRAVGTNLSAEPIIKAAAKAVNELKK